MKLGIVNQHASTGGWKFLVLLVKSLKRVNTQMKVTIYYSNIECSEEYLESLKKDKIKLLEIPKDIKQTFYPINRFGNNIINKIYNKFRKIKFIILNKRRIKKNIKEINNFETSIGSNDLIFYSWPYNIEPYLLDIPMCFIPHDFIFTHFFGFHSGHAYTKEWYLFNKTLLKKFVDKGTPIVSSQYIAEEFSRTFTQYKKNINIVYLSKFNDSLGYSKKRCEEILKKYGLENTKYVLYANNWALHKNMQVVIGSWYKVKKSFPNIKLVITGYGTNGIYCQANSPYYWDHVDKGENFDIISLGLVPEDDFIGIIQASLVVLNTSLCEAGAGSANDAWNLAKPVIMSDIPAFRKQAEYLGTKAEFFDPRNSNDLTRAIIKVLKDIKQANKDAEYSKKMIDNYSWDDVAKQYLKIFKKIIHENNI